MSEEEALWLAVGETPGDSLPRLVLADWLEENAGTVECVECRGERTKHYQIEVIGYVPLACKGCVGLGHVPDGRADTAAALRATADRVPRWFDTPDDGEPLSRALKGFSWNCLDRPFDENVQSNISKETFAAMPGGQPDSVYKNFWRYYPTALDAIRSLCRAWVTVHRGKA